MGQSDMSREQEYNYIHDRCDRLEKEVERLRGENKQLKVACASGWGEPTLVNKLKVEVERLRNLFHSLGIDFGFEEYNFSPEQVIDHAHYLQKERARLLFENMKLAPLQQAVGLMTTAKPSMEMRTDDPVGMAQGVVAEVERLQAELITVTAAMQECLKILKGDKIVHSTLEKELLNASAAARKRIKDLEDALTQLS